MAVALPRALQRHRLRWLNGTGFALTLFLAVWLVVLVLSAVMGRRPAEGAALPMPFAFLAVGAVSLVATLSLLGVLLFRYAWHGVDFSLPRPRLVLFAWTCAAEVFFVSQTIARLRGGARPFPAIPDWMSDVYWLMAVVGAVVFSVLMWVNAEGAHLHHPHEEDGFHDDAAYDEGHDEDHGAEPWGNEGDEGLQAD